MSHVFRSLARRALGAAALPGLGVGRSLPAAGILVALLASASALAGQSLLSSGGLGLPLDPLGARARALGSPGIGLQGAAIQPSDPAGVIGVPLPTVTGTFQPTTGTLRGLGPESDLETTRFPLFAVAYPAGENDVLLLSFGSFLEQDWGLDVAGTVQLGGEDVPVIDRFTSDGGVSTVRLGWARRLPANLGAAVTVGLHLGDLFRSFAREFDDTGVGADVDPFIISGRWRLTAPTASIGLRWDPLTAIRVSGSVSWSGDLDAEPQDETSGGAREFPLPLEYRLGASADLTPRLTVTAGATYADWTEAGRALTSGSSAGSVASLGGGLEWTGFSMLGRTLPLRLGLRQSDLPFRFAGADASELVFAGGVGANLIQSEDGIPLAAVDFAAELGGREAGSVEEDFTRFTVTLRVAGN